MKKIFSHLPIFAVMAMVFGMFTACKPSSSDSFSVKVKEVGPEYVEISVTAPSALELAYLVDTKEVLMNNPHELFNNPKSEELVVTPNSVIRVNKGLKEDTQYYIYIVAKLDAYNFSQIFTLSFHTTEYKFDELLTVVEQFYDGYKMRITVPRDVKERGNGIRYNQCCIMMYNYLSASDDYTALLYNAGNCVTKNTTLTYTEEENWYQTDTDSDGNGELDWDTNYNPVSPGEPVVFVAGEFAWMEDTPEYKDDYYMFPAGWDPGYYLPLLHPAGSVQSGVEQSNVGIIDDDISKPTDSNWYGAFQRKHFRVKEPAPFDGEVLVECVEASPINLTLDFYPDENVVQYAIGVFDDGMYREVLKLCNNNEDYLQWAITSYFAAYTFGTRVATDAVRMKLTTFYYADAIKEDSKYHVLVTPMGDLAGTTQSFQHYEFWTTQKTKGAPEILVTPVEDKCGPYKAVFNIKCTTYQDNPAAKCCFAANYLRDWQLALNAGGTYWTLTSGNFGTEDQASAMEFYGDELAAINSAAGYEITIPSVDGETTRIAVAAYNDEYTPNNFNYSDIELCPAVSDYTTPWVESKPWVDEELYHDLVGEWMAEAQHKDVNGSTFYESSKITLAKDLYDYPSELSQEVYDLYAKTGTNGFDKDQVDAMWAQFKNYAQKITENRLQNQNRLVGIGWIVSDQYQTLKGRTPYDLFVASDYMSVDVSSLYNDYGPKWYLEAEYDADGNVKYSIPFDSNLMPPAANWTGTYYLGGGAYLNGNFTMVTYGDGWTPAFPVTVSADRNTITIHPFEYSQGESAEPIVFYPNMVGVSSGTTSIENTIISEITLTRVTSATPSAASAKVARKNSGSIEAVGNIPHENYKPRTTFSATASLKEIEGSLVSVEEFKERADRFIKEKYTNSNN